ncbi:MAG TPA: hypothetical protein VLR94_02460, partial [Acidobacteriota bacterium]|nr:hypothetical protein [Acidobacteriota bacterium]
FEDATLATDWTYIKPLWTEPAGGNLIGRPTGRKAIAVAMPVCAGCTNCSVEATMATAGGTGNRLWLLGWYGDKRNTMELMMKQETGKWILKERIHGSIVAKAKGSATIVVNQFYDVVIAFSGTTFTVTVDGTLLITLPAHGAHFGTTGFQAKGTTGSFGLINVN